MQVESFSQGLKSHQKAVTGDGTTVLEKAVVEHNLAAASRLYNNIYFAELGQLLGVTPAQAESVACRMIAEERLKVDVLSVSAFPSATTAGLSLQVAPDGSVWLPHNC